MKPATYKLTLTASTDVKPLEEWGYEDMEEWMPGYDDIYDLICTHHEQRLEAYEAAKADDEVARRQERVWDEEHDR